MPMLRNRLSSAVPSVRSVGSSVAKAITCNGRNTKPKPTPWMMALVTTSAFRHGRRPAGHLPHRLQARMATPIAISRRPSTRSARRPAITIAAIVPMPRGAMTSPAASTG